MKVSWEYYSQHMESHKSHVPNHQPVIFLANNQHHLEKYEFVNGKDYPIYYGK